MKNGFPKSPRRSLEFRRSSRHPFAFAIVIHGFMGLSRPFRSNDIRTQPSARVCFGLQRFHLTHPRPDSTMEAARFEPCVLSPGRSQREEAAGKPGRAFWWRCFWTYSAHIYIIHLGAWVCCANGNVFHYFGACCQGMLGL